MATLAVWADSVGMGLCRSCDARITWVEQTNGKKHPLDGRPEDLVPVQSVNVNGRQTLYIDTTVNTSHFATCPDADKHRKGR